MADSSSYKQIKAKTFTKGYADKSALFTSVAGLAQACGGKLAKAPDTVEFKVVIDTPLPRGTSGFILGEAVTLSSPANSSQGGNVKVSYDPQTTGSTLDCTFWCAGLGIQSFPHPVVQTQTGYAVLATAGGGTVDQPAFTNIGPGSMYRSAIARIGIDSVLAKHAIMQNYDLELELGCKYKAARESLATIGEIGCDGDLGHGTMLADSSEDIRFMNDQTLAQGGGYQFFPQNSVLSGGVLQPLGVATTPTAFQGAIVKGAHRGRYPIDPLLLGPTFGFNLNLIPRPNCEEGLAYAARLLSQTPNPTLVPSAIFSNNLTAFNITLVVPAGTVFSVNGNTITAPAGGIDITKTFTSGGITYTPLAAASQTQLGTQVVILGSFTIAGQTFQANTPAIVGSPSSALVLSVSAVAIGPGDQVICKTGALEFRFLLMGAYVAGRFVSEWLKNHAGMGYLNYLSDQPASLSMLTGMMQNNYAPLTSVSGLSAIKGVQGLPAQLSKTLNSHNVERDEEWAGRPGVDYQNMNDVIAVRRALYAAGTSGISR